MTEAIWQRDYRKAIKTSFGIARGEDVRTPPFARRASGIKRLEEENVIVQFDWERECMRPRQTQSGGLQLRPVEQKIMEHVECE